jgi:hypothetical protein
LESRPAKRTADVGSREIEVATELFCLKPRKEGAAIVARIDALLAKLIRPRG